MSHAGQESYFFVSSDGKDLRHERGEGIVNLFYSYDLRGSLGIGENNTKPGARPAYSYSPKLGKFAVAFDGYLTNGKELREKYGDKTDGEIAARFIADANDFVEGVKNLTEEVKGNFCIVATTEKGEGYGARCQYGIRSLLYAEGDVGFGLGTTSRAFSHTGMEVKGNTKPGEIVGIDGSGIHTLDKIKSKMHICSFYYPYYDWIDCALEGIDIDIFRERLAEYHAKNDKKRNLEIDIVSPIPESGTAYALYYAIKFGCPYMEPIIKYEYAGRSYDRPGQEKIDIVANVKISSIQRRAGGKRILLTDDSIRRGSQLIKPDGPISLLHLAGAKEIHLRIGSPKNLAYCRFRPPDSEGYKDEVLAANRFKTNKELARYLKINSVDFPGIDDFAKCIIEGSKLKKDDLCLGCYTGDFGFFE